MTDIRKKKPTEVEETTTSPLRFDAAENVMKLRDQMKVKKPASYRQTEDEDEDFFDNMPV